MSKWPLTKAIKQQEKRNWKTLPIVKKTNKKKNNRKLGNY